LKSYQQIPIVSALLVGINVLVFLICMFMGDTLYNAGLLNVQGVLVRGEYGRILWSMFLHGGINHIFNNMLILFFLGAMIEKEVGHVKFAVFYFLSGIGGNLLSLTVKLLSGDASGSIGASGAVFGLDGVLLSLALFSGKRLENVTPVRALIMIVLSLYSGYATGNIDNAAHIGGLITGFLMGGAMCFIRKRKKS